MTSLSQQYVADIRTVQKLLQETEQTIDKINQEEDFYNLENTSYPEIDELREIIDPYQKLFNLVLNWRRTESRSDFTFDVCAVSDSEFPSHPDLSDFPATRWMDGCFQTLDGETMEVKVDEFFREIFKMLKFFQQKQIKAEQEKEKAAGRSDTKEEAPKKQDSPTTQLCTIVMEQVKDFKVHDTAFNSNTSRSVFCLFVFCNYAEFKNHLKCFWYPQEHIPVVTILCNPGISTRHWAQMSDIVGYDLTPDSGTTLRKVLKQNLTPYLDQFESISVAASKVRVHVVFHLNPHISQMFSCLHCNGQQWSSLDVLIKSIKVNIL